MAKNVPTIYCAAVICLTIALARGEDERYYKTNITPQTVLGDQSGEKTENVGFVKPLDFASFTQQFFAGSNNFANLPFTAGAGGGAGGFDFFGAESKEHKLLQPPSGGGLLGFPSSPFNEEKQNSTGFVETPRFISAFNKDNGASFYPQGIKSTLPPRPTEAETAHHENEEVRSTPPSYRLHQKISPPGKSNYPSPRPGHKSDHSPGGVVYSNSEDVEVFLPREKLILPHINGRPKPYDGYRAASDVESQIYSTQSYPKTTLLRTFPKPIPTALYRRVSDKRPQTFVPSTVGYGEATEESRINEKAGEAEDVEEDSENIEEDEEEKEIEEDDVPASKPKRSGFKYQHDTTITVPDLVIKTYPYEVEADNDREFTSDFERYIKSYPSDLEKHFSNPEFRTEKYTYPQIDTLAKNSKCEKIEPKNKKEGEDKTCYECYDPKTGESYEQCAYEEEPKSKKYFYGGATSSQSQSESKPVTYRYRRSLDFQSPSSYEYFIYNDEPTLNRKARAETTSTFLQPIVYETPKPKQTKKKTKKFKAAASKKVQKKRKPRQEFDNPSAHIEGPPSSYEGPQYTYEGPSSSYEGPSIGYEGPDHDNYYDRTDDRIPYKDNPPLLSSFFDDLEHKKSQKRPRRGPKSEVEEFGFKDDFSSYRFGPEYFVDEEEEKPEPIKRNVFQKQSSTTSNSNGPSDSEPNEEFFKGNVKIFKNGDICEKKKKDSMVCMVCNNDKTGATYEQCQYSTKPNEQRYAFNRQNSYTSNKPGQGDRQQRQTKSDQFPEKSDKIEKKVFVTKVEKTIFGEGVSPDEQTASESRGFRTVRRSTESTDLKTVPSEEVESYEEGEAEEDDDDGSSRTETSERIEARDGIEGLDEFLDKASTSDENYPKTEESYEDYFKRVFPEFQNYEKITPEHFDPFSELSKFRKEGTVDPSEYIAYEESESANEPTRLKDQPDGPPEKLFDDGQESKENVEIAFGEFKKRDWSKCKKIQHDKLTCYQCLDKNGIKNEECMYVDPGEPVKSHKAYHEKKDYDPAASSLAAKTEKDAPLDAITSDATPTKETKKEIINAAEESIQQETRVKGDYEGVKRPAGQLKRQKRPLKKTESQEQPQKKKLLRPSKKVNVETSTSTTAFNNSRTEGVDGSVVKIYLNGTSPNST